MIAPGIPVMAKALRILAQLAHEVNGSLQDAATDLELLADPGDDDPLAITEGTTAP